MSALGVATGVAVLAGWALDNPHLKSLQPGLVTMKPNDAAGLIFIGMALWLLRDEAAGASRRRVARTCSAAAVLIGLATLSEYAVGWELGIDQLLFPESGNMIWTSHPGRMAPTSAVNLVLLGTALAMLDRPRRHWGVEVLTLLAVFISVFAYLGHVYALELLHGTGYYTHMAVHTAAAYCLLCAGVLTSRPQRGFMTVVASETPGGVMARRLLPATILGPALLAWVGFVGQRSGYYGTVFGLALLALAIILAFSVLVLWSASSLYHVDVERERAEVALRASRERLQLMVDGAKDYAIFMVDLEGTVQSWNPGAERIHGYREEDIIGHPVSRFYTNEDVSHRKPQKDLATAAREGAVVDEGWRLRNDGSRFWANAILTALRGDDGRLRGFAMLTRDVSERRRIEEQLKDANVELSRREEAVKAALADVTKTHEALKSAQLQVIQTEKMESVGRIAAGVAHEVKNPLAIILSGIDYLGEHANGDPVQGEILQEMEYAVARADRILGGLLDFSAPRSLELHFENLNTVIEQALLLVKHELDRGRVSVVRELARDLPVAWLDKRKIEQVFINVFLNAIQAMPKGGTLTVKTWIRPAAEVGVPIGSRTSRVVKRSSGRVVVAQVDDTGMGIPEELMRKVFEPFFTTKPTKKGTGLGLTVAKAIVEMHGGVVSISNRGRGGVQVLITLRTKGDSEDVAQAPAAGR
jgi:PAS domain S-box-containing protein